MQDDLGDVGKERADALRGGEPFEQMYARLKALLVVEAAQVDHLLLEGVGIAQALGDQLLQFVLARQAEEKIRLEHTVEQRRVVAERFAKGRGRAENIREQREHLGPREKQREDLRAGGEAVDKLIEIEEGGVRVRGFAKRGEQRRHQLGKHLARAFAAGGAPMAAMPALDNIRDALGFFISQLREGGEGFGIGLHPGEDEVAIDREGRRILHRLGVDRLHAGEGGEAIGGEMRGIFVAREEAYFVEARIVARQAVGLFVGAHLQAMLDHA